MSNSSFLDRPLLKVSRPVAACSRCRTAKIRCDGKLPACSACERAGKADTCSSSDEFPRGKERSYVGSLEAYCERLEKRAAELRERKRLLTGGEGGVVHENSITSASSVPATHAHSQEVSNIDDLVGEFGYLSVSATSRDFQGITSNTSFANLILAVSSGEQIPRSSPRPLPSRSEITPLIQHYFETFYVQLPFFLETSFWASVDSVYQNGAHFAKPFDNWAVRMVLAMAYGSLSNSQLDVNHRNALSLVQEALQYTEDVWRPEFLLIWDCTRIIMRNMATSTALDRTLSFSDDSVNVAFPSSKLEKTYIFSHSSEPAWNMVKIRRILSAAYQQKYFTTTDPSFQSPTPTWVLYSQATEWFYNTPKNISQVLAIRYHLEFLYTITVILAPSTRHLPPCDYTKLLLFNRCIDYVHQLHQILESQIRLHVMDSIEIQRVYQTIRRLFNIVNQSFDVLMSPVPAAPQVPEDCPKPPSLELEDCLHCHERALECLNQAGNLLQYGARRWNHHALSQEFQKLSAPVRSILLPPAVTYAPTLGSYMPEEPAILPPADFLYGGLNLQHSSPENHNYE
ncbi:hypothetical protein AN3684.2 [Aspergillus nidulans FGSC A4]|nr:hypothetical protein AN3684.2 [Aspergillus nidulans FGSC A4]|eukprot:XP_661288.1 hypothetical protein AN3684.2 [Aspergillus nidulans FGSC A4]